MSIISPTSAVTAISCGQLINGVDNQPIPDAVILIRGDRIIQVGGKELLSTATKIINLSNFTVLPGLY